jgi:ubiquitin C-terminal hydrolase
LLLFVLFATGYMNSVLQALSNTQLLKDYYSKYFPTLNTINSAINLAQKPAVITAEQRKQREVERETLRKEKEKLRKLKLRLAREELQAKKAEAKNKKKNGRNGLNNTGEEGEEEEEILVTDSSSGEDSESDGDLSLSKELSELLQVIWKGKRIQFTPDHFLRTVWRLYQRFRGFKQQDAQEFALFVLNQLSKEQPIGDKPLQAPYTNFIPFKAPENHSRASSSPKFLNSFVDNTDKINDFITQNFGGKLRTQVSCDRCRCVSKSDSEMLGIISIQIPPRSFQSTATPEQIKILHSQHHHHHASNQGKSSGNKQNLVQEESLEASQSTEHTPNDDLSGSARSRRGTMRRAANSTPVAGGAEAKTTNFDEFDAVLGPPAGRSAHHHPTFTLDDCLRYNYCVSDRLEGEDGYSCSKCKRKTNATKQSLIAQLPAKYLIIHVIRTIFDPSSFSTKKDQSNIIFPLRGLDMNDYVSEDQRSPGNLFDCYAIVNHHGRGMNEGHFTSFALCHSANSWLLFNDARVTPVAAEKVQASQAYLLFFERRNFNHVQGQTPKLRAVAAPSRAKANPHQLNEVSEGEEMDTLDLGGDSANINSNNHNNVSESPEGEERNNERKRTRRSQV